MAYPKIMYPTGGTQTTLQFVYPPCHVSPNQLEAIRYDELTSSGERQSNFVRTDIFISLDMPVILLGSDLTGWETFLANCVSPGLPFDFYADSSLPAFTSYLWEGADAKPQYSQPGIYRLDGMKWRQYVP